MKTKAYTEEQHKLARLFYIILMGSGLLLIILGLVDKPRDTSTFVIGFLNFTAGSLFLGSSRAAQAKQSEPGHDGKK